MPQLDLISFFPQIFWCFILFFAFFFYFSFLIIPKVATTLKFRKQKLVLLANKINEKKDGSSYLLSEHDGVLNSYFFETRKVLDKVLSSGNSWIHNVINQLNITKMLKVNQYFLRSSFFKDVGQAAQVTLKNKA